MSQMTFENLNGVYLYYKERPEDPIYVGCENISTCMSNDSTLMILWRDDKIVGKFKNYEGFVLNRKKN